MKKSIRLNIKKIKPQFTRMVVTADTYTTEECMSKSGILEKNAVGVLKEIQKVVSVNPNNHQGIKEGDMVCLSFDRYQIRKHSKENSLTNDMEEHYQEKSALNIEPIILNHKQFLFLDTSDILFVIEESEIEEIIINDTGLITDTTKPILLS